MNSRKISQGSSIFDKVDTICQLIDNRQFPEIVSNPNKLKEAQCLYTDNSVFLQQIDYSTGRTIVFKRCNNIDKILIPDVFLNDLRDYFIYSNDSPTSYLLNGYNTAVICLGGKGSCKSRMLFGNNLTDELSDDNSLVCNLIEEIIKYVHTQNSDAEDQIYTIGIAIAEININKMNHTEKLIDLISGKNCKDVDSLTNVQIV